jgi:uncharacterized protein
MSSTQPGDVGKPRLPRRRAASAADGEASSAVSGRHRPDGLLEVVGPALGEVSGKDPRINGLLVASTDGLVLASNTRGVQTETVAAMAAAAASIAGQFTNQADVGESKASLFEGASGYVGVFPVEPSVLLVVFGQKDMTMGLFNVAARTALSQLQQALHRQRTPSVRDAGKAPREDATAHTR